MANIWDHYSSAQDFVGYKGQQVGFLDRDGTICHEQPISRAGEQVALIEGSAEGVALLKHHGYYLIVITNQPRISRGEADEGRLREINDALSGQIETLTGERIDHFLYCPHEDNACPWRKPNPGMLQFAALRLGLDITRTTVVGDSHKDILAGQAVGARTIQVLTRNLVSDGTPKPCQPNHTAPDLLAAAHLILRLDGLET